MGFKIALAIAVENFADARVACKKDRANVLVLRYRSRGTITAIVIQTGGMRLLIWAGPDVNLAMVVPFAFKVEGTVMGGPGLQDQVMRLPHPVGTAVGHDVSCRGLVRYAADKPAFNAPLGDHVD